MLISIITINFNNLQGLKKTITSVLEQTYSNIEYIVIDGGSTDGSTEYIESCHDSLAYWVSEPDKGIYNGMNKGVEKATGDYVLFLNSGDWLVDSDVVKKFVQGSPVEDIVYGDVLLIYKDKKPKRKYMPDILEGLVVFQQTITHQSIFHKRSIFKSMKYDLNYKILADWVFYNTVVLIQKGTYRHIDLLIVNYDTTGFSSKKEQNELMRKEREQYYTQYADYFVPLLLQLNEHNIMKFKKLQNPRIVKWAIKIAGKLNLIK